MKGIKLVNKKITARNTDGFGRYLNEIQAIPVLTPEEEKEVVKNMIAGNEKAKEKLITSNLRFVISVANQYQTSEYPFEDLVSQGNIGLIDAADSFNPEKDVRFISYAVWKIRSKITNYINRHHRLVRISGSAAAAINKIRKQRDELTQIIGRFPSLEELAEYYINDIPSGKDNPDIATNVKDYIHFDSINSEKISSLNQPASDDITSNLADTIQDDMFINQDEKMQIQDTKNELSEAISTLKEKEQIVINHIFGLNGYEVLNPVELADKLGISRQTIYSQKDRIIKKLREKIKMDIYL